MNNQLKKELKIFTVLLIIFCIVFYFIGRWYNSIPNTYVIKAQETLPVSSPSPILAPSELKYVYVKVSHYDPSLGGVNCANFQDGKCISKLANGERWEDNWKKDVIACPPEWKFGTKIKVYERIYTCKDRGSKIVKTEAGEYWIDILTDLPLVPYGKVATAEVL